MQIRIFQDYPFEILVLVLFFIMSVGVKEFRIKRTAHIINLKENTDTPEKARTLKKKATLTKLGDRKPKI